MLGYWASATDRSATNRAWGWHPHGEIWSLARMKKSTMIGSVAANFHEGSRSEILADYLFSSWGTVSPVRRQDDYGVDLFCTLTERIDRRARVQDYFAVQVRSKEDSWKFNDPKSVKWLVEHPI